MNTTDDERRVVILYRLEKLARRMHETIEPYARLIGGSTEHEREREKLRLKLAEIADGLGKACD